MRRGRIEVDELVSAAPPLTVAVTRTALALSDSIQGHAETRTWAAPVNLTGNALVADVPLTLA